LSLQFLFLLPFPISFELLILSLRAEVDSPRGATVYALSSILEFVAAPVSFFLQQAASVSC
jgi:hypothetical protein